MVSDETVESENVPDLIEIASLTIFAGALLTAA